MEKQDLNQKDYNKRILKIQKQETERKKIELLYLWVKTKELSINDFEALIFYCA